MTYVVFKQRISMFRQLFTILTVFVSMGVSLTGCSSDSQRKIRMSDSSENESTGVRTASSVLQVSPEDQRNIAILFFENQTGDANLDWLRRGLTDMLATDLKQSHYLNVVTVQRLQELLAHKGPHVSDNIDVSLAIKVASDADIENILAGRIYRQRGELFIEVEVRDQAGRLLRRETVNSPGMEQIFSMVNDLSQLVRANLRGDLVAETDEEFQLSDMTESVDAFRCYSEALENNEKLIYAEAERCLEDAIRWDSTFAAAHLRLAQVKRELGKTEEGVVSLRKARKYADKLSEADRQHLSMIESRLAGDVEQEFAIMQELLRLAPHDIDTRMRYANMCFGFQDYEQALQEYSTVLKIDPTRKLAYNQLAYVYARIGDFNTALKRIEKYQELAPNEPNPYDSKGEILMMAGRLEEAEVALKTALDIWPEFYHSAIRLSNVYGELGDLRQALDYSDKAIASAPGDRVKADLYTGRALLLWRFGKSDEAKKALQEALSISPTLVGAVRMGAEMLNAMGDSTAIAQLYQSYFDHYKKASAKRQWEFPEIANFLVLIMDAEVPPARVIPLVEAIAGGESPSIAQQLFEFFLGVLYLRAGDFDRAQEIQLEPDRDFIEFLTRA
ncbi:MAG: tetratricopeptide repeat protein, partial [Desulfatiglandales bacterium]